ncbi:MAG TPA: hypothetical protein VGR72_06125 [Candidatus Acidoferrales bacterium]|nr:hypothetical protein [Candidatus Acidoferrales bacterium]
MRSGRVKEITFTVKESSEGGYEARALGHSIFTHARTLDELRMMVRDAVSCHFEVEEKPAVIRLRWVKDEVISA